MQKPKVGNHYRIFADIAEHSNIMKIVEVKDNIAKYYILSEPEFIQTWDFKKWDECLNYKLSSLEVELL